MNAVYVAGAGSTRFGRHTDMTIEALAVDAAARAIVAERLGLHGIPCTKVEGACASGGIAFHRVVATQTANASGISTFKVISHV